MIGVKTDLIFKYADSDHTYWVYPNLYQNRRATQVNQIWVSDTVSWPISFIVRLSSRRSLAVILDAYSRKVIGWGKSYGSHTGALMEKILEIKPHPEMGFRSCMGILRQAKNHDPAEIEAVSIPGNLL